MNRRKAVAEKVSITEEFEPCPDCRGQGFTQDTGETQGVPYVTRLTCKQCKGHGKCVPVSRLDILYGAVDD
jgi:DnaJ-class molecular chaperone